MGFSLLKNNPLPTIFIPIGCVVVFFSLFILSGQRLHLWINPLWVEIFNHEMLSLINKITGQMVIDNSDFNL